MSDDRWTRPPGSGQDGGVRRPADEPEATPFPDVSPAARRHPSQAFNEAQKQHNPERHRINVAPERHSGAAEQQIDAR